MRTYLILGALLMAAGVAAGAFGAHALKPRLDPQMLIAWQTAVQYHLVHALALVVIAFAGMHWQQQSLAWPAGLLLAGILLFSGSLYVMALSGMRWLGPVTPLGGMAFIAGWLSLAWVMARHGFEPGS